MLAANYPQWQQMLLSLHHAHAHCVQIYDHKQMQLVCFWQQASTNAVQIAPSATGVGPAQASLGAMPHDNEHGSALSKPLQPRNTNHQMTRPMKHDTEIHSMFSAEAKEALQAS